MPLPSHASSLIRSFRFERNTNISPPYGSAQSACATSATSPCTPRRKSIGCVATHTRSPARVAIKPGRPAPPPAPATTSPCRHRSQPVCLHRPARSRGNRRSFRRAPRPATRQHLSAPCRQHIRIDAVARRNFRHFRAGDQTLSHDRRFAGSRPPSSANARTKPALTGVAKQTAAFHHAIHRRTFRQSATDDIFSTRAQNL